MLCVACVINSHVAVVVKMIHAVHTGSARLAARNRELTAHTEVSLDVHAHQHSDAEMPRPVFFWSNRRFDPNVARRRNIELRLLRRRDQGQTEQTQHRGSEPAQAESGERSRRPGDRRSAPLLRGHIAATPPNERPAHEPPCSADIPVCGFAGHSCPVFLGCEELATGKSPEPAGWKACATSGNYERLHCRVHGRIMVDRQSYRFWITR